MSSSINLSIVRGGNSLLVLFSLLYFFSSCSHLFYHPSKENFSPPHIKKFSFKDIFFQSSDGVRLHGRIFFSSQPTKGTLVQLHGNSENLSSHSLALLWVTRHGYNLFTFDYRGYGQSMSTPSPEGIRLDALAFLEKAKHLHQRHSAQGKFIVVGQSLGGAIALRAIQDFKEQKLIDLVVLDSSFSSYQKIAFKKLASHWATWLFSPLAYLLVSDKISADLHHFKHPLLIIHSLNDPIVPFSCALSIYQKASSPQKTLWEGRERGHILAFSTPKRQQRFLQFLQEI